jgi:hypothetical protein
VVVPVPARGAELGQFVQEQDTVVSQRDFPRVRPVPAAHQAGVADGVVWGSEGPVSQ